MSLTKKLLGQALSLTLSASTMNCLESPGYDDVYYVQNSIYGTYKTKYKVTEDPDKLYNKKGGETELKIYTLGHDAKIRFRVFYTKPQDYKRHPITGEINESWEALDYMYPYHSINYKGHVFGNITNDGQLDLIIDVDFENLEDGTTTHAKLDVWGHKASDELE